MKKVLPRRRPLRRWTRRWGGPDLHVPAAPEGGKPTAGGEGSESSLTDPDMPELHRPSSESSGAKRRHDFEETSSDDSADDPRWQIFHGAERTAEDTRSTMLKTRPGVSGAADGLASTGLLVSVMGCL